MIPLYEAKMIHLYDTRWATYTEDGSTRTLTWKEKQDRSIPILPRYWVHEDEVERKLDGRRDKSWMLGWRDICRSTDVRTVITTQLPYNAYNDKILLAFPTIGRQEIQAIWSSFAFDFVARQKMGGTSLKYFTFKQLPMPTPEVLQPWTPYLAERVDRLNAQSLSEDAAAVVRAELDAAAFHIYGLSREDADYILGTFPIVEREDRARFDGAYRTKDLILEHYDALARR